MSQEASEAIRLGDTGFFPYYILAASQWHIGAYEDKIRQTTISQLQKCIELNPIFAPADDLLSQIYAMSPADQKEAIHFAILAVNHKPGDFQYAFHLTQLLLNNNRDSEAKIVADSVAVDAYTPEEKEMARQLVDRVANHKDQPANGFGYSANTTASGRLIGRAYRRSPRPRHFPPAR